MYYAARTRGGEGGMEKKQPGALREPTHRQDWKASVPSKGLPGEVVLGAQAHTPLKDPLLSLLRLTPLLYHLPTLFAPPLPRLLSLPSTTHRRPPSLSYPPRWTPSSTPARRSYAATSVSTYMRAPQKQSSTPGVDVLKYEIAVQRTSPGENRSGFIRKRAFSKPRYTGVSRDYGVTLCPPPTRSCCETQDGEGLQAAAA